MSLLKECEYFDPNCESLWFLSIAWFQSGLVHSTPSKVNNFLSWWSPLGLPWQLIRYNLRIHPFQQNPVTHKIHQSVTDAAGFSPEQQKIKENMHGINTHNYCEFYLKSQRDLLCMSLNKNAKLSISAII